MVKKSIFCNRHHRPCRAGSLYIQRGGHAVMEPHSRKHPPYWRHHFMAGRRDITIVQDPVRRLQQEGPRYAHGLEKEANVHEMASHDRRSKTAVPAGNAPLRSALEDAEE